ncbi:MAG: hypothetical protein LBS96_06265 [Oscillospiraceae bacterium]|jgi:hypothetical protein|nr:hypothetical protein [Oscillospiraceae bacterium]
MPDDRYLTYMGLAPKRVPHWEHWSDPDAETYLTGIDYYEHPRLCRLKFNELYPEFRLGIPRTDAPKPRPKEEADADAHVTRWGDSTTATFQHGEAFFNSPEEVFAFSPLEHAAEFRTDKMPDVVESLDFSSEEAIAATLKQRNPGPRKDGEASSVGFYNTMFMWPLLTFGWELFMECCLDERFERVMDEFAEINRRVFRAISKLPVNFVVCHDDIVMTNGPVCSPAWMHKYIFPRYEEYWAMCKAEGKEVIFMVDGNVDAYAEDVLACGARGIITEPYTDFKTLAKKHPTMFLAGEGDNRVLLRNDPKEIEAMVKSMAQTAQICGGYMMDVGNHIPWNVPGEAVKRYIEFSREYAIRP